MTKKIPQSKSDSICAAISCNVSFVAVRSGNIYCSKKCLNAAKHRERKIEAKATPPVSINMPSLERQAREIFQSNQALTEMFYNFKLPQERLDLCLEILDLAADGNGKYRKVLTAPYLIKPDLNNRKLFYRGSSASRTIAEIVNSLCHHMFGISSVEALREKNFELHERCKGREIPINMFALRKTPYPHKYDPKDRQAWCERNHGVEEVSAIAA